MRRNVFIFCKSWSVLKKTHSNIKHTCTHVHTCNTTHIGQWVVVPPTLHCSFVLHSPHTIRTITAVTVSDVYVNKYKFYKYFHNAILGIFNSIFITYLKKTDLRLYVEVWNFSVMLIFDIGNCLRIINLYNVIMLMLSRTALKNITLSLPMDVAGGD